MVEPVTDRQQLLESLRRELFGPDPRGEELDCTQPVTFATLESSFGPWRQRGNGEEILQRDPPTKRYGIGVLYPMHTLAQDDAGIDTTITETAPGSFASGGSADDLLAQEARHDIEQIQRRVGVSSAEIETDDLDLSSANTYRQSSIAVSFLASVPEEAKLVVHVTGGRYQRFNPSVEGHEKNWWLRSPIALQAKVPSQELYSDKKKIVPSESESSNLSDLDVRVEVYTRPFRNSAMRLLTVCVVNRSTASSVDERSLFQVHFKVHFECCAGKPVILPYPAADVEKPDEEEESMALLYREMQTFAIGHGCAADWNVDSEQGGVTAITAECLPTFQTPGVTPDIRSSDGKAIEVSMAALAGLIPADDGIGGLEHIVDSYEHWIDQRRKEAALLPSQHKAVAERHLKDCARCAERMREGIAFLKSDHVAMRAFRLANKAVLLQQLHSRREARRLVLDERAKRIAFSEPYRVPDPEEYKNRRWRAFQIAFLLMSVKSTALGNDRERATVELIWFPTGGGKTEAYLALAAFSMLMRRLRNPSDAGVEVLMRYTLRLLTAQQFQRAATLLCALDYLRREPSNARDLGDTPFSIGIWLGGTSTPNKRQEAKAALAALNGPQSADNPFLITKCPWCSAEMGPVKLEGKLGAKLPKVYGYERQGETVVFRCPDRMCDFASGLPIFVIDEDVYLERPTLVIGTVDKFAMLAWRPEARTLFGIGPNGEQEASPPGLIIQDELHLISGPLGSMVGLYEALIEDLCTDRRKGSIPPKLITSTATIRRYAEQVKSLYGRDSVALFPPPGLRAGDSFFAQYARREDGSMAPGRIYVGVHAPGLGSVQTAQVRAFTSLLQAPLALAEESRDPWWTLVAFFNSLRELGTTLSLFQSDIPDYLKVIRNRTGASPDQIRRLRNIKELTGRLPNQEIPLAISLLEAQYGGARTPVDVCLASNIIEVGVDIDRLSLITVVGQPKTTSQYIQVTGRVGRRWWERPGLVVTIYGASKPRDRSHFEKFRTYHERLYAQVEPTSVTPYSRPALERALHAIMVGYVRQCGTESQGRNPFPVPEEQLGKLRALLGARVAEIDPAERPGFERLFDERLDEWRRWERSRYSGAMSDEELPLLRPAGAYASREHVRISWPTPQSMRNVDAECQVEITTLYLNDGGDDA